MSQINLTSLSPLANKFYRSTGEDLLAFAKGMKHSAQAVDEELLGYGSTKTIIADPNINWSGVARSADNVIDFMEKMGLLSVGQKLPPRHLRTFNKIAENMPNDLAVLIEAYNANKETLPVLNINERQIRPLLQGLKRGGIHPA